MFTKLFATTTIIMLALSSPLTARTITNFTGMDGYTAKTKERVVYRSNLPVGTIVIHTKARALFYIVSDAAALRYTIAVGRPETVWHGKQTVSRKAQWPGWRPSREMLTRSPDLPHHIPGGPKSPLGARALYLGSTLYRIHGTPAPASIGRAVTAGCIRMRNVDVVDLYDRVKVGARVLVRE